MYSQDFEDLDGHSWQITYMDMSADGMSQGA